MLLHQSDLTALARCAAEYGYKRAGFPMKTNSAAAYGSVMHFVLAGMERALATGGDEKQALKDALHSFVELWNPMGIERVTDRVPDDGWLPRQSYSELRARGIEAIKKYWDLIRFEDYELLGTEFSFVVPIDGSWDEDLGEPHYLAGSIDRLAVRHYLRKPTVAVDDWKTGVEYTNLRQNLQGTAYCMATTRPEFWLGFDGYAAGQRMVEDGFGAQRGQELYERFLNAGRRFTWVNLRQLKFQDGGWRGPHDYNRFALAADQFAALVKADIYPMSISGSVCRFCDARGVCGGTGVPTEQHGAPA